MNILAIDTGYGDVKVVSGDQTGIKNIYKFPSVAAIVETNTLVSDDRLISYRDKSYYIGKDALHVQSSSIIDISSYELLEFFTPLFVYKAICDLDVIPDILVLGLSIAQINNSAYYKKSVEDFLRKSGNVTRVYVVPQGAIAKLAVEKYGVDFPNPTKNFNSESSYIIADIGFNTLDICHVVNGKTSSNLVRGIEKRGAMLIVNDVIIDIKATHGITLNSSEGKDLLVSGVLKRRGQVFKVDDIIKAAKLTYVTNLKTIIENEFGSIMDKVDSLVMLGGGSYFLDPGQVDFIKGPKTHAEFYNCIGYYIYGLSQKG